jgi:hypothetical protein
MPKKSLQSCCKRARDDDVDDVMKKNVAGVDGVP